jgi:hypothetical protein
MTDAGFYKADGGVLLYAPDQVSAPDYTLLAFAKDTYSYPVDGWSWFDSEMAARIMLKVPPPQDVGQVIDYATAFKIPDISDRQFFQEAAMMGLITQDEALQAVKVGAIPAALQSIVDAITDPNAKFAATMLLAGATTFQRDNALTNQVGMAMGWTSAQLDDFFLAAALL